MQDKFLSHLPATAFTDYVPILSQKLTFNSTLTCVPLTLEIIADQAVENTESLSASLMLEDSLQRSVIELNPNSTNITIIDSHSEHHSWFNTKFACCIYLDVKTLYATLSIDYVRLTM